MEEIIVNLHMHTFYSDGHVTHADIADAALRTGIDVAIVTDHNVYVDGPEGYFSNQDGKRTLLLIGEEIHDQARIPQKNHLLVFGHGCELATLAADTPRLLEAIRRADGLAFLAHPYDPVAPAVGEDDLSWEEWPASGFTGIELWNAMSEFKGLLKTKLHAFYYVFNPERIASGPFPKVIKDWDERLAAGRKIVAVGGTDAHALPARLGPLKRVLFPFDFHFKTINTHLLLDSPLSGELDADRAAVIAALRKGRAFIGYDLPAPTRGFRFTAQGLNCSATMGEEITSERGVTFQVRLPLPTVCRLVRHGETIQEWRDQQHCTYITSQPGAYRVEADIHFRGRRRGWIYSNPIYIKARPRP